MRRYLPVLVLFVLSPLIAEIRFGATPLSNLGSLLVTAPLYGGALLITRCARSFWVLILMGLDLLIVTGIVALLPHWSTGHGWGDVHRLA